MEDNYDDIISLEHPVSRIHPRMTMAGRAAQFAPFSALSGYGETIRETARQTERLREISEENADFLNRKMTFLRERIAERHEISVVWFQPDNRKDGGAYQTSYGWVRMMDDNGRQLIMMDGTVIPYRFIFDVNGEMFENEFF